MFELLKFLEFGTRVADVKEGKVYLYIKTTQFTRDEILEAVTKAENVLTQERPELEILIVLSSNDAVTVFEIKAQGMAVSELLAALGEAQLIIKQELDPMDQADYNHKQLEKARGKMQVMKKV